MDAIKIVTFTPVWKRPEVFQICLKGIKRLQEYSPEKFKIQPFFIVSEASAVRQVMKYGFDFIYFPNQPLGAKKNAGLKHVLKNYDFDYLMEIGSDDLMVSEILDSFEPWFRKKTPQIAPHDVWFVDTKTGKTAYWVTDRILGLGRSMSREAIEKVIESEQHMWSPFGDRGMDTHSWRSLSKVGIEVAFIKPKCISTIDIKSSVNINTLEPFTPQEISYQELLSHFPEGEDVIKLIEGQ